jgi:predicted DNA-binding protein
MNARRTTILADPDLLDRVDRHARLTRTTKTAVITAAIEAYLEMHAAPAAVSFVAVGRSSHGRLSLDTRRIVDRELGSRRRGDGG